MTALPDRFHAERVAPSVVGEADARTMALLWLGTRWLPPRGLVSHVRTGMIVGSHVPFFVVDAHAIAHWEGAGHRGIVEMDFADIPICADPGADAALLEALEPWPVRGLRPHDAPPGDIDATAGQRTRDDAIALARKRMEQALMATARRNQRRDARDKVRLLGADYPREVAASALLPVWRFDFPYLGRSHRIAVNGLTGKVAGSAPVSRAKLAGIAVAAVALWLAVEFLSRLPP